MMKRVRWRGVMKMQLPCAVVVSRITNSEEKMQRFLQVRVVRARDGRDQYLDLMA